jgi:hypothetical protein
MNILSAAPSGYAQAYPTTGTTINGLNTVNFSPGAGLEQGTTIDGVKNFYWVGRISTAGTTPYMMLGHDTYYDWHGSAYAAGGPYLDATASQSGIYNARPVSQYGGGSYATVNTTFSTLRFPASGSVSFVSAAGITGSTRFQGLCYDRIGGNCGWCGDLAEVITFSQALTTDQHQQVEGYLAAKWGLQTNLPATHPYSTLPAKSFPGLQLWLDAADPAGTGVSPTAGTSVTTWTDKSGKGNNATLVGSAATISATGVSFGGSSYFRVAGLAGAIVNTAFVIFVVETFTGSSGYYFGDDNVNNSGTAGASLHTGYRSTTNQTFAMYTSDLEDTNVSGTGNSRIWALYMPTASNRNTRRNGNVDVTFTNYNRLTAFTAPRIGRAFGENYYTGGIAEILVYNQDIGLPAIQLIEKYLATKWNITLAATGDISQLTKPIYARPFQPVDISGRALWLDAADPTTTLTAKSFPGLQLWLDAADPAGTGVSPTAGTSVTTWTDKSGKGNNATLVGSAVTTSASGLTFGGSSYYTINGIAGTLVNTPFVVFVVETLSGSSGGVFGDLNINNGGAVDYSLHILYRSTTDIALGFYGDDVEDIAISGTGTTRIWAFYLPTASNRNIRRNGTVDATHTNYTRLPAFTAPTIGRVIGGYSGNYSGTIAEVLVFNQDIGLTAIQSVEKYLSTKWNVALPLQPVDIPGCTLWLDAADPTTVTGTSSVTAWRDKSGNANNMSLTAGSVSYASNTMTFASGGILQTSNYISITSGVSFIYVVCQATSVTSGLGYVIACTDINSGDTSIRFVTNTTSIDTANSDNLGYGTGYYVNGVLSNSNPVTVPTGYNMIGSPVNKTASTRIQLSTSFNSRYFIGNIYEVIVYPGPLSSSQRQQVEAYLAWKWGIRSSLPSTHPGYTLPSYSPMFTPKSVAGMQLWLDAADSSTITGTSPITAWNDKSGNGNNGTASGSPVLLANSINGSYPSIYFDGASSIAGTTVNSGRTLTAFCILQTTDADLNTNGRLLSLSYPGRNDYDNVQSCIAYDQFNGAKINTNRGNRGSVQVVYNVPVGTSALVATIFYGDTSNTFYANGSLQFTSTDPSWNQNFSITTYCIGNAINPNGAWYKGRIGEIILFNTALTTSQRQQVEGYLAWKWGLQSNLPSTHAFAKISP